MDFLRSTPSYWSLISIDNRMGLIYSFCFGNAGQNSEARANAYKVDEQVVTAEPAKTYSWDKRRQLDPRDYTFDGLRNEIVTRPPGAINGQQFIIQNCQGCTISLFDHSATVTIDDCTDCNILIGPCKGSVFIRDCSDCRMMIACQQYRTRDCHNFDTYLLCQTQPIIEASAQMRFGCLQLNYDHFQEHLDAAKLSIFNNNWSKIHDFTPADTGNHYTYISEEANPLAIVPIKVPDGSIVHNLRADQESSLVPLTLGKRSRPSKHVCFCLLFTDKPDTDVRKRCLDLIRHVSHEEGCRLVATNEVAMMSSDVERLTSLKGANDQGPIVAMEWSGEKAAQSCRHFCQREATQQAAYIVDGQQAASQLKEFYNYVDMQHGV